MNYPLRAAVLNAVLLVLVAICFLLPVFFGTSALLPVPVAAWTSVILAVLALIDASYHAFSPTRGLRALTALGAGTLIAGWLVWVQIFNTIDVTSTTPYRIGTFLLAVGAVLSAFCLAIALTYRGPH
ncbi:hypothetical protein [Corynebacterium hiratae]|uniref:Multidrug transporter n=1 Tax=Corynebacterium hiratae TaxID=3139423 RepID=A0A553G072_9CORY|nr:hypothetical protein [Corynebacterium aurimucosum]TRX62852.1 hypothetical protein FNY97_04670 [Corynebacterium aurimucosum]